MSDLSEQNIKGYKLLERIGSGSYGAVYRSRQSTLGRDVAVKIILPGFANHPDFIRRFEIEAQFVIQLEHLHIVPLYDYWRDPSGAYLVMRWMHGGNLREAIDKGPFDLRTAATILDQIASGLATAHRKNIIHRDIKPSNILLDEDGNAYLSDFGIAIGVDQPSTFSEEDQIIGSPDYISPEQARKERISPKSDIYCLGITLYEMLTGEYPYPNLTDVERFFEHINTPLPQIKNLDPTVLTPVNDVIQIATAKNPQQRFRDVLEMAATFRTATQLELEGETEDIIGALTKRELEIWKLIADGKSNKDIAQVLFVEISTVKWHITQLYRKIGVRTRVQAIKRARETAFVYPMLPTDEQEDRSVSPTTLLFPELINPYKGLLPFEAADNQNFFGRESLVKRLLERLKNGTHSRFIAVVGPSGSGKSSLVKAGLIPALWRGELPGSQNWFTIEMVPGSRPLDELEVALTKVAANQAGNLRDHLLRDENGLLRVASLILPNDDSQLVLVVDQFEEVFTLVRDEQACQQFINLLCGSVNDPHSRVFVIITLRADYYDRPLQYPKLGELMRKGIEPVLPLSVEELEQAIVRPASRMGVHYETGLVARIIDDVNYQPAALPLLQYALTELFDQAENRLLTHQAYDSIGGTVGAVAKRAEDLYQELDQNGMDAARNLFLRLVAIGDSIDGEQAHPSASNRVLRSDIMAIADDEEVMDEVLDAFSAYRLLALDHDPATRKPTIELAHESILKEWDRLAAWVDEYKNDLIQHRRLFILTQEWIDVDMDAGYLLREVRLDQFSAWAAVTTFQLSPTAKSYLDKSLDARLLRNAKEEDRQKRELETIRKLAETERKRADEQTKAVSRMRSLTYGLAAALVLAVILSIGAFAAFRQSDLQRRLAESRELAAAAISQLENDPELSILLALQSVLETSDTVGVSIPREAEEALHRSVQASRIRYIHKSNVQGLISATIIPDELHVLFTYEDGTASLVNFDSNEEILSLSGHESIITQVVFHPDGGQVATISRDHTATIWDLDTGREILTIQDTKQLFNGAFHPDGMRLATTGNDINTNIWDLETGNLQTTLMGHSDYVSDVEFNPDGDIVVTSSLDGTIKVWDANSGNELYTLDDHAQWVQSIDFSPSGLHLASASTDGVIIIWNAMTWEKQHVIHGHSAAILSVEFNPDGSYLASAGEDQIVKLWDAISGQEIMTLPVQKNPT
jgi:serine/threonine protein kinase